MAEQELAGEIIGCCFIGVIGAFVLPILLYVLYHLTEGVEGIGRRLYAMLLVLLSALGVGVLFGVPMALFAGAFFGGLFVVAAAAGIPIAIIIKALHAAGHAVPSRSSPEQPEWWNSWLRGHLAWIKRVAQGNKGDPSAAEEKVKWDTNKVCARCGKHCVPAQSYCPECGSMLPEALFPPGF
jgi:hypothetical protein